MANKSVFQSSKKVPVPNTINNAGGTAFALSTKESLAQMVCTGVFNSTYYTTAESQLDTIKCLLDSLAKTEDGVEFVAKLAIYARESGYMKDMPAFLTAWLTIHGKQYLDAVFPKVVDNGKMLRNFVQMMRSGVVGRKSLGTKAKTLVKNWIVEASPKALLRASVGNTPSLSDIIKMVHPAPRNTMQSEFFKWIMGKSCNESELPSIVKQLIAFRRKDTKEVPDVPFELLTSLNLSRDDWKSIAKNAGWHMTRMNLNTFHRYGVYEDAEIVKIIAKRLSDREIIKSSNVMPYQLFTTWLNVLESDLPIAIQQALYDAVEVCLENVPVIPGKTHVFVDVSGSMNSSITGYRRGSTSRVRCVDVASLIASAFLRVNPQNVEVTMFDTKIHRSLLRPDSSVFENSKTIAKFGGGGTYCQLPLMDLCERKEKADLIIYVSDNESWITGRNSLARLWDHFKRSNPQAKMVCIDLTPNTTTQGPSSVDVLNVGGFSDTVFGIIDHFVKSSESRSFWVDKINTVIL